MAGGFFLTLAVVAFALFGVEWAAADEAADSAFLAWFRKRGGVANKVGLGDFEGMGRGVKVLQDVLSEEEVLRIPLDLVFSAATLSASPDAQHRSIVSAFGAQNDDQIVAAALLLERARGTESAFFEYIQVLPENVPNFSHFSSANLAELQQTDLQAEVSASNAELVRRFPSFASVVSPLLPAGSSPITLDEYRWALSIVDSRGLRFKGKVHLAPFADMFNYAPHPRTRPANSGEFFLTHHQLQDNAEGGSGRRGFLVILADRSQAAGGQLFEDYGDNTDKIYARYHGFVPDQNPFRCATVTAPAMGSLAAHQQELIKALRFTQPPQQCIDERGVLDEGLVVYLASSVFTPEEAEACVALKKNHDAPWPKLSVECGYKRIRQELSSLSSSLSSFSGDDDVVSRTLLSLQKLFASALAEAEQISTLEQDEASLREIQLVLAGSDRASGDALKHQQQQEMAIRFRLHHKRLVASIFAKFKATSETKVEEHLLQKKLDRFNRWFQAAGPSVNKLEAALIPGFRIGTVATATIVKGEKYLGVPTSVIMDSSVAWDDLAGVASLLKSLSAKYNNARDDFHELLFFLLHEYFVIAEKSRFWPYLSLLPTTEELDIPAMWSDEQVTARLGPSLLANGMLEYRNKTRRSFDSVVALPLVSEFFASFEGVLTWENYKWATSILDSRSIWWNGKRHLVPMLDFVNCAEGPDPSKVHSTELDESERHAVTKASWDFSKAEQVFENYGQPNSIYYSYHGFSLPIGQNSHDCVQHELRLTDDEAKGLDWSSAGGLARQIATRLGFRNAPSTVVCLKTDMPESVWLFYALKLGTFEEQRKNNTLGLPTPEAEALLAEQVAKRLEAYDLFDAGAAAAAAHEPSMRFLATEKDLLRNLLVGLRRVAAANLDTRGGSGRGSEL